jgi:site-specific recombinase XerD
MSNRKTPVDDREHAVIDLWRKGHLSSGTIQIYLQWVRRFRAFCESRKLDQDEHLTRKGVRRFIRCYAGPRLGRRTSAPSSSGVAHNALHAWSCALRALGVSTPLWQVKSDAASLPPLLREYRQFRKAHCGVSDWTLRRDIDTAGAFLALLRSRRQPIAQTSLKDVDVFVSKTAARFSTSTVADTCSSLRAFLRFLHTTGRLVSDLAGGVMRPRFRVSQRTPRTLPWDDVRRILRSIEKKRSPGKRDFAIMLLLATYGLGAAEVLALRIEDIDWTGAAIRARRPKTKARVELPLLPAVARALTDYLRWERPPAQGNTHLFLRKNMPYEPMTSGAIRHRIRHWATLAGIRAKVLGAHVFRHSHATRQVDAGANIKIVSDILGHRSVSSTSVYVRVALKRLRGVALAVPR